MESCLPRLAIFGLWEWVSQGRWRASVFPFGALTTFTPQVTLFCLVFGHLPFRGDSILELYENIREAPLEIPATGGSPELSDLLTKMLDKNPETRIDIVGMKVGLSRSRLILSEIVVRLLTSKPHLAGFLS